MGRSRKVSQNEYKDSVKNQKVEKICYWSNESAEKMLAEYGDGTRPGDYGFLPDLIGYFSKLINRGA